jgi:hypothetical protein
MWRTGRVETLNIFTERITIPGRKDLPPSKAIPVILKKYPPKHKKIIYSGYSFFLPSEFEESQTVKGEYVNNASDSKSYETTIQFSVYDSFRPAPLKILAHQLM